VHVQAIQYIAKVKYEKVRRVEIVKKGQGNGENHHTTVFQTFPAGRGYFSPRSPIIDAAPHPTPTTILTAMTWGIAG
jgi:hypothetical protein